jgi:hypothetical protein
MDIDIPKEYRLPYLSEIKDDWRKTDSTRYTVVMCDLNGDGEQDITRLIVRKDSLGFALLVTLSGNKNKSEIACVVDDISLLSSMGIRKIPAGQYLTVAGKGYVNNNKDLPDKVVLNNEGIDFFKYESANSVIFWDSTKKQFTRIWLSD